MPGEEGAVTMRRVAVLGAALLMVACGKNATAGAPDATGGGGGGPTTPTGSVAAIAPNLPVDVGVPNTVPSPLPTVQIPVLPSPAPTPTPFVPIGPGTGAGYPQVSPNPVPTLGPPIHP